MGLLEISKRITSWFFALFVSGCLWIILGVVNLLILDGGACQGGPFPWKGAPFLSFPVGQPGGFRCPPLLLWWRSEMGGPWCPPEGTLP